MNNFERMQQLDNEYEMADLIMFIISNNYGAIIKGGGELEGLPVLHWLQKEYKQ